MDLQQLLSDCSKHDTRAQQCFYRQFAASMFLLCRRYVKSDETAEEMMMNGFLKFFRGLQQFTYVNEAATIGWLRKIMVNECLMELRSTHSFLQLATDEMPETALDEDMLARLSAEEIFRLVTRLPVGYRTVFNLYVVEEMTHREIAEALRISEGTSRSQLSKARQLLQQMLLTQQSDYVRRKTK